MSYCIIKTIDQGSKPPHKVIMLRYSAHTEVWEFKTEEKAQTIADNLQLNSDSGHTYEVKKIGASKS